MELHGVLSVSETEEVGVYISSVDITDKNGERYVTDYTSRPDDTYGLAPIIRAAIGQWIAGGKVVAPYEPPPKPTPEQVRASMSPLTARQLRLGLVGGGFSLSDVEATIDAIQDPQQKAVAQIEWQYAVQFERMHPLIEQVGASLGLTPEQIDTMWQSALEL